MEDSIKEDATSVVRMVITQQTQNVETEYKTLFDETCYYLMQKVTELVCVMNWKEKKKREMRKQKML